MLMFLTEPGTVLRFSDEQKREWALRVEQDYDVRNPLEDMDGEGRIYSFSRRHSNFLNLGVTSIAEARKELIRRFGKENIGWLQLGYFEHGQCVWFPWADGAPAGTAGDFQWDGTAFAGVWVPDEYVRLNIGKCAPQVYRKKLLEYCRQVCRLYTAWCNGSVYGYTLACDDVAVDSCWGFFDTGDSGGMLEAANATLRAHNVKQIEVHGER